MGKPPAGASRLLETMRACASMVCFTRYCKSLVSLGSRRSILYLPRRTFWSRGPGTKSTNCPTENLCWFITGAPGRKAPSHIYGPSIRLYQREPARTHSLHPILACWRFRLPATTDLATLRPPRCSSWTSGELSGDTIDSRGEQIALAEAGSRAVSAGPQIANNLSKRAEVTQVDLELAFLSAFAQIWMFTRGRLCRIVSTPSNASRVASLRNPTARALANRIRSVIRFWEKQIPIRCSLCPPTSSGPT